MIADAQDWTTFLPPMRPKLLEEPLVLDIAKRVGKSPAQVLLRWNAQQGIPTQPRSMNRAPLRTHRPSGCWRLLTLSRPAAGAAAHMRENLDVFSWQLSDNDMHALSHSASAHPPPVLFSAV